MAKRRWRSLQTARPEVGNVSTGRRSENKSSNDSTKTRMANSTAKNAKPLAMRSAGATGPGNLPALRSGHPVLPAEAAEAGAVVGVEAGEANALRCSRNLTRTRTASSTRPNASRHANTSSNSEAATEKHAAVHAAAGPQDQAEIRVADPHDRMATAAADLQDLTATGAADLQDPMVTGVDSVLAQIIEATVKSRHVIFQKPSGLLPLSLIQI